MPLSWRIPGGSHFLGSPQSSSLGGGLASKFALMMGKSTSPALGTSASSPASLAPATFGNVTSEGLEKGGISQSLSSEEIEKQATEERDRTRREAQMLEERYLRELEERDRRVREGSSAGRESEQSPKLPRKVSSFPCSTRSDPCFDESSFVICLLFLLSSSSLGSWLL
jgi:hypothetical protein